MRRLVGLAGAGRAHRQAGKNGHDRRGAGSPRLARLAREMIMAARKAVTSAALAETAPRHARRCRGGARPAGRRAGRHRLRLEPHALQHPGLQALAQVREPAVHGLVQGARRAQPPLRFVAEGEEAGRDRHVGRQPRPGRGLSRPPAVDPRHHRHARQHADREGGQHPPARRRGDPDRRDGGGGGRVRAGAWPRQGAHLHPPLRRSAGDRRPGHAGAGDAGHGARDRHADRADRRRRADLRHCRCRQSA